MNEELGTIIIGGGQAGLATSYYLEKLGCDNIILEQSKHAGNAWRNDRWDSFHLLTPNWSFLLPGIEYQGDAPNSFMQRDEIVARFKHYVERFHLPIHYQMRVNSVIQNTRGQGYLVRVDNTTMQARNVVIATGRYQQPNIPSCSANLTARIEQLHSGQYRNPYSLPDGAVLVVGSGQSGSQIAEELHQSGRKVYLCVGSAGRLPRVYRGKDVFEWLQLTGFLDRTVDKLPAPKAKFKSSPHVSGRNGRQSGNLYIYAREGITLLGRVRDIRDNCVRLATDLQENLVHADKYEAEIVNLIDDFILQSGLHCPDEKLPQLQNGFAVEEIQELNLDAAGINTVIWATGYKFDFSLVQLPIFDADRYPVHSRGITNYPGLYFVGLPWLYKQKSGLIIGVGEDAEYIASRIASREHAESVKTYIEDNVAIF